MVNQSFLKSMANVASIKSDIGTTKKKWVKVARVVMRTTHV